MGKDTLVCTNQHSSGTNKLQRSSKVLQGACELREYKVGGLSGNIKKDIYIGENKIISDHLLILLIYKHSEESSPIAEARSEFNILGKENMLPPLHPYLTESTKYH